MDTLANEGRRVVRDGVIHAGRKVLLQLLHLGVDHVGRVDRVGARQLENGQRDRGVPVVVNRRAVVGAAELDAAYLLQPRDAAVGAHLDDDVAELGGIRQPALRIQGVLERGGTLGERRSADDSGCDLDVLLSDRVDDVARSHVARRHLVGIEPQPHRVVAHAEQIGVADARQPGDLIFHLEGHVVAEEDRIVRPVGREERERQRDVRRRLLDDDPLQLHLGRKLRQCDRHPVLHLHLRHVEVGADLERHRQVQIPGIGGLAGHVQHVLDAVDLFLERRGDSLRDGFGVGAGIGSSHGHGRRRDLRILSDRQREHRDRTSDERDQRKYDREDRAINKKMCDLHWRTFDPDRESDW